ncbi:hypothetical protein SAMN05216480_109124 [Pustulibacterium marinum]|uniref:Uncharacterized protein n=1 Tax=Pustulibacterium marinum TaxID=1224947 RepID=A0A1I7HIQ5_9FLAO|nr:hypothetical protein [Pustulibacterium marinum]SFU60640.1 hypothetical protein SAMN05216480_109124 [Pustulibacterium marinum]
MDNQIAYKIINVVNKFPLNKIIDSETLINKDKKQRLEKMFPIFDLIHEYSIRYNKSVFEIRDELSKNRLYLIKNKQQKDYLVLKKSIKNSGFLIYSDFQNNYLEYVIEKARIILSKQVNTKYSNRLDYIFFFKSKSDCIKYLATTNQLDFYEKKIITIAKIQFTSVDEIAYLDNNLLSNYTESFTVPEYVQKTISYWLEKLSEEPLIEILFKGKFKILEYL